MSLVTRQGKGSKLTIQEMDGNLTYLDQKVAGGVGKMMMIDTNRTDSYTELGTADKPFKTFSNAITTADESASTAFLLATGAW
jgi:hypothetical protein